MAVEYWGVLVDIIIGVIDALLLVEKVQPDNHVLDQKCIQVLFIIRLHRLELPLCLGEGNLVHYLAH